MSLADLAQKIISHAAVGPSTTPGQKVKNSFSPSLERLIVELVRGEIIKINSELKSQVNSELAQLEALISEPVKAQYTFSVQKINSIIQSFIN